VFKFTGFDDRKCFTSRKEKIYWTKKGLIGVSLQKVFPFCLPVGSLAKYLSHLHGSDDTRKVVESLRGTLVTLVENPHPITGKEWNALVPTRDTKHALISGTVKIPRRYLPTIIVAAMIVISSLESTGGISDNYFIPNSINRTFQTRAWNFLPSHLQVHTLNFFQLHNDVERCLSCHHYYCLPKYSCRSSGNTAGSKSQSEGHANRIHEAKLYCK